MAKAKKQIRKFEKASAKDLRKDVKRTGDVIEAAFGNVQTAHKGTKKRLSGYNARQIDKVIALKDRMNKAGRRDVERVKGRRDNFGTMGGMLNASYTRSEKNAEAGAKTGNAIAKSGKRLVENLDETSRTALQMMKYGAEEAKAGAEQAMYDAEAVRAKTDAETAAQMRFQLATARLEHQLRIKEMEKQAEIDRKNLALQTKSASGALGGSFQGIQTAASTFASIGNDILRMRKAGEDADAIRQWVIQNHGITTAQDLAYVNKLIDLLSRNTDGSGREEMINDITQVLETVPGWGKLPGKKKNVIRDLVAGFVNYDGIVKDIEDEQKKDEETEEMINGNTVGRGPLRYVAEELGEGLGDLAEDIGKLW